MGGGGGGTFNSRTPEQIVRQVREAEDKTSVAEFEGELSAMLGEWLAKCNDRDADLVRQRLDSVKEALEGVIDGSFDQLFGGSVAKHTYVNGLSDIDSLILIDGTGLVNQSPQAVLTRMREIIGQRVFFLSVVQLKTDWKGRSDAHKRTLDIYAEVKREARYLIALGSIDEEAWRRVLARYDMASAVGIGMPERDFLREKRRHKIKVAVSRHLDKHPSASLALTYLRLWARDNLRIGSQDGTKPH